VPFGRLSDIERILGIQIHDPVILKEDTGNAIVGGGQEKRVVEAHFQRTGLHLGIPINPRPFPAKTKVPLSYHRSVIARLPEELGKGEDVGRDREGRIRGKNPDAVAKSIETSEHGIA
jgi:hypothetical protein